MNFVTISKFWLFVSVTSALAVTIAGAICIGYVITQCLKTRTLTQLQVPDMYEASHATRPLTESVLEPMNLLSKLPPPPISIMPQEIESSANETNYQTELYDYPCHRDFFLNENKHCMKNEIFGLQIVSLLSIIEYTRD